MTFFASFPMYDWPQIRQSTDAYWAAIRESLCDNGLKPDEIPHELLRETDPHNDWVKSELLISQTCGLPYVRELRGKATLLGTPSYEIDCDAGSYFSVIIAHGAKDVTVPETLALGRVAYNDICSQSGYAAYFQYLNDNSIKEFSGELIHSGSHLQSIKMVAEGKADFAAIDAISFELAKRFEQSFEHIQIIAKTAITPGLPYITSLQNEPHRDRINRALSDAIGSLSDKVKSDLMLARYVARHDTDYEVIAQRWAQIVECGFVAEQ